jgi:hypothetical protein
MKKTIILSKAISLKDELERAKLKDNERIKELYKTKNKKGELSETVQQEITEIQQLQSDKSTLLVQLTELIAEQNLKVGKGEKFSNTYYIKYRSERVQEKKLLEEIGVTNNKIREISMEIDRLDGKLSKFNLSHKVKIEVSQEILDSINIVLE